MRKKGRKRNKSSPLVQSSPKKTKQPKQSKHHQADPDIESEISDASSDISSLHDSGPVPDPVLETPRSSKSAGSNIASNMASSVQTSDYDPNAGVASNLQSTQGGPGTSQPFDSNPASLLNPLLLGSMSMSDSQLTSQQMFPIHHPSVPVPMPAQTPLTGLSDQDIMRVALMLKAVLKDEIEQLVKSRVALETEALRKELCDVKASCEKLKSDLELLNTKHDDIEQYSRRMCLRLSGIPETSNENVSELVLDFAKRVGADVGPSDIDRAHRVGKPTTIRTNTDTVNGRNGTNAQPPQGREIIIKFTNSTARLSLLKGRAKLREDRVKHIFINEDLTPARKTLAYECRRIKRLRNSNISKTWVYAGYPWILDRSGRKVKITCLSDLAPYHAREAPAASIMDNNN